MLDRIQASWSGSENQRREQGVCRPPTHEPNTTPRFFIPAGTQVAVRRADRTEWQGYVTKRDLGFGKHSRYDNRHYFFREGAYELKVHRSRVNHLADSY